MKYCTVVPLLLPVDIWWRLKVRPQGWLMRCWPTVWRSHADKQVTGAVLCCLVWLSPDDGANAENSKSTQRSSPNWMLSWNREKEVFKDQSILIPLSRTTLSTEHWALSTHTSKTSTSKVPNESSKFHCEFWSLLQFVFFCLHSALLLYFLRQTKKFEIGS